MTNDDNERRRTHLITIKYLNLNIFNCGMVRSSSFVFVVVRHTPKILPIVHAAAGAHGCRSNGIWRICDFDFWHEKLI